VTETHDRHLRTLINQQVLMKCVNQFYSNKKVQRVLVVRTIYDIYEDNY